MSKLISGAMVSRYFDRVLGARRVATFDMGAMPSEMIHDDVLPQVAKRVCLLVEIGSASSQPSLQQMGARLVEAIRNEWLKKSVDHLPEIEWCQASQNDWEAAADRDDVVLAIVCGAQSSPHESKVALHVPSFAEMNSNPVLKRDAWRAIQGAIAGIHHT